MGKPSSQKVPHSASNSGTSGDDVNTVAVLTATTDGAPGKNRKRKGEVLCEESKEEADLSIKQVITSNINRTRSSRRDSDAVGNIVDAAASAAAAVDEGVIIPESSTEDVPSLSENGNKLWDLHMDELKAFKASKGHCLVPKTFKANPSLGKWVTRIRSEYDKMQQQQQQNKPVVRRKQKMDSSLNEERIKELNDIGFVWEIPCSSLEDKKFNKKLVEEAALAAKVSETPSDENALWTLRFEQLKLFQAHTGHCLVPKSCPVNPELSRWVRSQRYLYQSRCAGKHSKLSDSRIAQLDSIGFVWNTSFASSSATPPKDEAESQVSSSANPNHLEDSRKFPTEEVLDSWNTRLNELKAFHDEFGHCLVPKGYAPNRPLGRWVCRQRGEYIKRIEGRKSHLSDHRVAQLDEIGFVWSKAPTLKLSLPAEENSSSATNDYERIVPHSRATLWSIRVEQLKAFKADNGHCLVPKIYKVNQSLSRWVRRQRSQYILRMKGKRSSITPAHIDELDSIGFSWIPGAKPSPTTKKRRTRKSKNEATQGGSSELTDSYDGTAPPDSLFVSSTSAATSSLGGGLTKDEMDIATSIDDSMSKDVEDICNDILPAQTTTGSQGDVFNSDSGVIFGNQYFYTAAHSTAAFNMEEEENVLLHSTNSVECARPTSGTENPRGEATEQHDFTEV